MCSLSLSPEPAGFVSSTTQDLRGGGTPVLGTILLRYLRPLELVSAWFTAAEFKLNYCSIAGVD